MGMVGGRGPGGLRVANDLANSETLQRPTAFHGIPKSSVSPKTAERGHHHARQVVEQLIEAPVDLVREARRRAARMVGLSPFEANPETCLLVRDEIAAQILAELRVGVAR